MQPQKITKPTTKGEGERVVEFFPSIFNNSFVYNQFTMYIISACYVLINQTDSNTVNQDCYIVLMPSSDWSLKLTNSLHRPMHLTIRSDIELQGTKNAFIVTSTNKFSFCFPCASNIVK